MIRPALLLFALAAIPAVSVAEVDPQLAAFIKAKGDPNELGYQAIVDTECPITRNEVVPVIDGVLVRSRVKPAALGPYLDSFFLSVQAVCIKQENGPLLFQIDVYWSQFIPTPILYNKPYGMYGSSSSNKDFILNKIKESVEAAVTDYVEVNFLTP